MSIRMGLLKVGIICLLLALQGCAQKYAVLVSTNEVSNDDVSYHSEWWYDLVLQYQALRDNGFKDKNIYVLYGSGTDFNTTHPVYNNMTLYGHTITDMAVNKANIQAVFSTLSGKIGNKDHLYVWWMGHGSGYGTGSCDLTMHISNTGETVKDIELASYMSGVANYKKRTVDVMTCHSGGMLDNMAVTGNRTVTLTSSTCVQSSYSISTTCNGLPQAEFHYTLPNALREKDPCGAFVGSDTDGNGLVSLLEVHQYNVATMTTSTPQLGDPDAIAPTVYLERCSP